jgi:TetR/AcrR family transcriptional repressor of nem operon
MARHKEFNPDVAVATAMDLFWRQGYGATTPAELADALGIGKGSLYNAFESKHGLFERALRHYGEQRVAGLVMLLGGPGSVRARLGAALERLAGPEYAHLLQRGCLAVNTATELGTRDEVATGIVREVFGGMERALASAIVEGQHNGEIAADRDANEVASLFLTTIVGMTVLAKTGDGTERRRRVARALLALV